MRAEFARKWRELTRDQPQSLLCCSSVPSVVQGFCSGFC